LDDTQLYPYYYNYFIGTNDDVNNEPVWKSKAEGQRMAKSGIHCDSRKDADSSRKLIEIERNLNRMKLGSRRALPYREPNTKDYSLNQDCMRSGSASGRPK
jgi:hypothetical protein